MSHAVRLSDQCFLIDVILIKPVNANVAPTNSLALSSFVLIRNFYYVVEVHI